MPPTALPGPVHTLAVFLPILGVVFVFAMAAVLRGSSRRLTLAIGPFLVGCAMWWIGPLVTTPTDNWLLLLVTMAIYGLGYLGICIYYVVLLAVAIGMWLRGNQQQRGAGVLQADGASNEALGQRMSELFRR